MNTRYRNTHTLLLSKDLFRRGIHFMFTEFVEPKTLNEDSRRHEFILNTILCSIIPLLLLLDVYILMSRIQYGQSYDGISFILFTVIVFAFIGLLKLSRIGKYNLASFILL